MLHLCPYSVPLAWQLFLAHFRDVELQGIGKLGQKFPPFPFFSIMSLCLYIFSQIHIIHYH